MKVGAWVGAKGWIPKKLVVVESTCRCHNSVGLFVGFKVGGLLVGLAVGWPK
jgi:hypothetical protein